MALTLDTNDSVSDGGVSISLPITVGAGDRGFMLVTAMIQSSRSIASVTYDGESLDFVDALAIGASTGRSWYVFKINNPTIGTANVVVTLNTAPSFGYDSHVWAGVWQDCSGLRQAQSSAAVGEPITYNFPVALLTTSAVLVQSLAVAYGSGNVIIEIPTGTAATPLESHTLPALGWNNIEVNTNTLNTNDDVYLDAPSAPTYMAYMVFELEEDLTGTPTTTTTTSSSTTTTTTTIAPGERRRFLIG